MPNLLEPLDHNFQIPCSQKKARDAEVSRCEYLESLCSFHFDTIVIVEEILP
jgi:hypothetical protein